MTVATYFESMDYGPAPEADGNVRDWLAGHDASFGHFIDGDFIAPKKGKRFATVEPATGKKLADVAQGSDDDVDAAVKAAAGAQAPWEAMAALEQTVAGRIILVGTSALGLRDLVVTPLGHGVPGVEVHGHAGGWRGRHLAG